MVYKKIGDKIPSLSSLLLAGALLGSCTKDKKTEAEQPTTGDAASGEKGQESNKIVDPAADAAAVQMIGELVKSLGLDSLAAGDLVVLNQNELLKREDGGTRGGQQVVDLLMSLCESFSSNPVYKTLKLQDDLGLLSQLRFKTGFTKQADAVHNKYAYGQALNEIAKTVQCFVDVFKEVKQKIDTNQPLYVVKEVVKRSLNPLLESLLPSKTTLIPTKRFYVADQAKLFTGVDLAKFFSKPSLQALLGEKISEEWGVWIVSKRTSNNSNTSNTSVGSGNQKPLIPVEAYSLYQRGTELDEWLVDPSNKEQNMVKVPSMPNGKLTSSIVMDEFERSLDTTQTQGQLPSGTHDLTDDRGGCMQEKGITFGTLLFTLFRGSEPFDFLQLQPFDSLPNVVKLIADNEKFQQIAKLSIHDFTKELAKHVDNNLHDFFPIANVSAFIQDFVPIVSKTNVKDPTDESILLEIYNKIESGIGLKTTRSSTITMDCIDKLKKVVANLGKKGEIKLTLKQRMSIKLAEYFTSEKVITINNTDKTFEINLKKDELINMVKQQVEEMANQAIVKKTDKGGYEATLITEQIYHWIQVLKDYLKKEHDQSSVSYQDIQSHITNIKGGSKQFDITKIHRNILNHCQNLNYIFTLNIHEILSREGDITLETFSGVRGLRQVAIDELNRIKNEYQAKKKKQMGASAA